MHDQTPLAFLDSEASEAWLQSYARTSVLSVFRRIESGTLTVITEYSKRKDIFGCGLLRDKTNGQEVTITVRSPAVWTRLLQAFALGFAEAYMDQEVECDNLVGLFVMYVENRQALGFAGSGWLGTVLPHVFSLYESSNTLSHARQNAAFHYDTSNTLFTSFLSSDLNYSCALWSAATATLKDAQRNKIQYVISKARISASDHVLDIGCGWGDLSIQMVKQTGCQMTALTLAEEQRKLVEERIEAEGLESKIEVLLCDYRQAPMPEGGYDRIVSIEMFEHVGEKFMNQYFETISRLLKPKNGVMVVQSSTLTQSIHNIGASFGGFVSKYIFPGGYLPTSHQILSSIHHGSQGMLEVSAVENIGPHYIKTLQCWRENFAANWERIRDDFIALRPAATESDIEAFRRKWIYYFTYCEAGFRARILGVYVVVATRTPEDIIKDEPVYP